MQGSDVIAGYESLARITGDMLLAAQNGDWDRLINLERHCRMTVDRLMADASRVPLTDGEQQRKLDLIRKILADDARIRELTEPRLTKLLNLLRGSDTARKLARTYEDRLDY